MDQADNKDKKQFYIDELRKAFKETKIPDEKWRTFSSVLSLLYLEKNEYLIREGDRPDKVAFVVSGLFRAFYLTPAGEDKTIVFRGKGSPLSAYSSFINKQKAKFSIQALEDSVLLYMTIETFENLLQNNPFWQINTGRYYMKIFIEKEKRERELLSDNAETRYRKFLSDYPGLINKINHYHIASYLGISNVTLSRIRNKSKK